ncbi:MAG: helix-turn-helix domain-containing protein [Saprospiraceae bacterium]
MPFNLNLPDFIVAAILALGVLQGVFIGGIFLVKRTGNQKANTFLGLLLIAFSLALLDNLFFHTRIYERYPQWWLQPIRFTLAFGPLLFYYVKFTLFPTYKLRATDSKHFVLPVWQASFYTFTGLQSVAGKQQIWENFITPYYGVIEGGLFLASFFGYLLLAYRYVRYKQKIVEKRGYQWEFKKINWIRRVLKMLFILSCINAVYVVVNFIAYQVFDINLYSNPLFTWSINLTFAAMLYWLGFMAYNHQFLLLSDNLEYQKAIRGRQEDYRTSPEVLALLQQQVLNKLKKEKLYRDPDLKLARLAQHTAIDVTALRYVFKYGWQKPFKSFIDEFRIKEAQQLLQQRKLTTATIDEIGLKVGFNNANDFIKTFKQNTQQHPAEYRSAQQIK